MLSSTGQTLQLVSEQGALIGSKYDYSKIDLENFNSKNDLIMWKVKMEAPLVTQGLGDFTQPASKKEGKEATSSKSLERAAEFDKKARGTIILSLADSR